MMKRVKQKDDKKEYTRVEGEVKRKSRRSFWRRKRRKTKEMME